LQLTSQTPAETFLLLHGSSATLKELLKLTFMDLLLKKVIKSIEIYKTSKGQQKSRGYKYIEVDKNFFNYKPQLHELVFLAPFYVNKDHKILFRHLIAQGYKKSKSQNHYQQLISKSKILQSAYSQTVFQMIFGGRSLTEEGEFIKAKSISEMMTLEDFLPKELLQDPKKALNTLMQIQGNIFLLHNIVFDLKTEIEQDFMIELNHYERFDSF
jgi:hypothetical protein